MEELSVISKHLELLEETLIYRFLERVQFAAHPELYQGNSAEEILQHSLLGLRLRAYEAMELQFGRYNVAEEFPFSPFTPPFAPRPTVASQAPSASQGKPKPQTASPAILEKLGDKTAVEADLPLLLPRIREISQCRSILQYYLGFLGHYCLQTEDAQYSSPQYGSALEHDVMVLQAISRRIHYGAIYVAEIKFREQEATLLPLILQWQQTSNAKDGKTNEKRVLALITRPELEQRILQRVNDKTQAIQANCVQSTGTVQRYYLESQALRDFYADCVIPLTKQGELAYLYRRA